MASWSPRQIYGEGPLTAKIVVIGESGGENEDRLLSPFRGKAGYVFGEYLATAGLKREDLYIDNVFPFRPAGNKIASVPRNILEFWMSDLHARIARLTDPWIIVPMGNYALYALLRRGKTYWHQKDGKETRPGILSLRGTVFEYVDMNGRKLKVIPTPHPAATFREKSLEQACILDWFKIVRESGFREVVKPQRYHEIEPTFERIQDYLFKVVQSGDDLSIDIENPHGDTVCIGYSTDPGHSLTIPTTKAYWGNQLDDVWEVIRVLHTCPNKKVFQNGIYDTYVLAWEKALWPVNWVWDTLALHHCIHAAAYSHSLEYMASIWTDEPYWKDEGKGYREGAKYAFDVKKLWTYCGKDAAVTLEIKERLVERLTEDGRLEFYHKHYAELFYPILRLSLTGITVNDAQRRRRAADCLATTIEIQDELERVTGHTLHAPKSLSDAKIKHYLYDVLRLPQQLQKRGKKDEKTASAGEIAVRKLMLKFPDKLNEIGGLILKHRRVKKVSEYFQPQRIDEDGRQRAQYWVNTEEGRLKSKKTPIGTGSNLQNVDREVRDIYLANLGHIGIKIDQSQAEARIVDLVMYWLTRRKMYLERAMARPHERDTHRETAAMVFGISEADVTKEQRQIAKAPRHALPRGMKGAKLQEVLLKEGYVRTVQECQTYLDAILVREPEHRDYFHYIEKEIREQRRLVNSWGRELLFTFDRVKGHGSDETYRRGYSFIPQSECAEIQNQMGLKPMDQWFVERPEAGEINLHNHDELFMSVLPRYAYEAALFLASSLEAPRHILGVEFSMPVEVSIGVAWKTTKEYKVFPNQKQFEEDMSEILKGG